MYSCDLQKAAFMHGCLRWKDSLSFLFCLCTKKTLLSKGTEITISCGEMILFLQNTVVFHTKSASFAVLNGDIFWLSLSKDYLKFWENNLLYAWKKFLESSIGKGKISLLAFCLVSL